MNITQYYCCRYQEGTTFPIDLPNADPFRLFIRGTSCPVIRGLKSTYTRLNLWTGINREIVTSKSPFWMYSNAMTTFQCYYQPPVYGCNQVITLDANVRSATVTTPGFPTARTPNRRCFYSFNVPAQSQILITFNTCDLSTTNDDTIIIKRYHQWQEGLKLDVTNCPSQVLSVEDYLNIEYWSGFDTVTNKGLNFTATVILRTCAPPTIPSDGLLVSTLKSSYRVGERAVIRCTQFTGSTDNVITCTPSGWTNLTKACIDCPYGWVIYGDRCFKYFPFLRNYTAAQSYCALYGSSGVLFEVRDASDQQTIRNYKLLMGSSYYAANFISGRLDSGTGNWLFSDSNAPMSYYNWSSSNGDYNFYKI
uniref:Sushi domain-containing protein n=1 Tax=Biomphalaria glabrata TaxID=6526 RepID=A0A2C9KHN8_BIOGL